jgi:hypothetical protein
MTLALFPNSLDPLGRVVATLLDEYPLGAMTTFRIAAPSVVSTTWPRKPGFQFSQGTHTHK